MQQTNEPIFEPASGNLDAWGSIDFVVPARLRYFIFGLAVIFLTWVLLLAFRHPFKTGHNTFSAFYYAACAIRDGAGADGLPPDYIYPPFFAWVIQPLTRLPVATAFRVWLGFSFLLTTSSMLVGWSVISRYFGLRLKFRNAMAIVLLAFLLSAGEAKTEWSVAQCDGLVLDSFSFSLALLASSPIFAGLVIALGANIKYQTLVLVPYLFWRGHYRAGWAALAGFPLIGALSALSMGWTENLRVWISALGGLGKFIGMASEKTARIHDLAWSSSISVPSAFARILPEMGLSSGLAYPISLAVVSSILVAFAFFYRSQGVPIIGPLKAPGEARMVVFEWSAVMLLLLAFGPQTTRRHLFILMLPHLLVAVLLLSNALSNSQKRVLFWTLVFYQCGLRLPPSDGWLNGWAEAWKFVGGPSWFILPLLVVLVKIGLEMTESRAKQTEAESEFLRNQPAVLEAAPFTGKSLQDCHSTSVESVNHPPYVSHMNTGNLIQLRSFYAGLAKAELQFPFLLAGWMVVTSICGALIMGLVMDGILRNLLENKERELLSVRHLAVSTAYREAGQPGVERLLRMKDFRGDFIRFSTGEGTVIFEQNPDRIRFDHPAVPMQVIGGGSYVPGWSETVSSKGDDYDIYEGKLPGKVRLEMGFNEKRQENFFQRADWIAAEVGLSFIVINLLGAVVLLLRSRAQVPE